jgi:hypothetical protein
MVGKPKFGSPCNGCGYCCQQQACKLSRDFLKSDVAPCIALELEDGRYYCGLVRHPGKHLGLPHDWADAELGVSFAHVLRLGAGCDADDPVATESAQR